MLIYRDVFAKLQQLSYALALPTSIPVPTYVINICIGKYISIMCCAFLFVFLLKSDKNATF